MARFLWEILARVRNRIGFAKQRTRLVQCKRHWGGVKHRIHQSRRRTSLNPRGLEMTEKTGRRASSKSFSSEEINANLHRLDAEMSERNPSMRKLRKTQRALERLERSKENLKEQIRAEAEAQEKAWEEEIARKRSMIEEEKEEIRFFNEVVIPRLATVILDDRIQDQIEEEPVFPRHSS